MSNTKKQMRVGFLSFFKLNLLYGLALGQLAGLCFFIMGVCGCPVHPNLGSWHVEGLPAGVGALLLLPPVFGIVSLVTAPVVFFPFTLACQLFGGFKVS